MENINLSGITAVITLGGKGTRLKNVTSGTPKPLWPLIGIHTLERCVKVLKEQGLKKFIWIINYKSGLFLQEAKLLEDKYKINIYIYNEKIPLGEAGSILEIIELLPDNFLFINGDIIFDIDINRFFEFHLFNKSDISFITHLTTHPEDSDCISETSSLRINKYKFKNEKTEIEKFYLGNAGIALIKKEAAIFVKKITLNKNKIFSLFKDFIILAHQNGLKVFSYNTSEYIKDMGTPDRLKKVIDDIKSLVVSNNSYRNIQTALFLDRDNTLIKCDEGSYITSMDQLDLYESRIKKISKLAENFNLVILVTNQPQIAMGKVSYQKVIDINTKLILMCKKKGLYISSFYICPHHNHSGFDEEIKYLKTACFCRKPNPGLFLEASYNRNISLERSLLIGDSWRDKFSAKKVGMRFLNVKEL